MYALIVKKESCYELQYKDELDSKVILRTEKCSNADILKNSLTLEWEQCEKENILWVAEFVKSS